MTLRMVFKSRLPSIVFFVFTTGLFLNRLFSVYPKLNLSPVPTELEPTVLVLDTIDEYSPLDPLYIFSVADGACMGNQLVTMLKSLLYYQGRYNTKLPGCELRLRRSEEITCTDSVQESPIRSHRPIHMHWVVDAQAQSIITTTFRRWKPKNLKIYLHDSQRYMRHVGSIPSRHYARTSTLNKFIVPYILPLNAEKAISFDADILLNEDVEKLWDHFRNFDSHQVIGGACEQYENCPSSCPNFGSSVPFYGINAGIMIMNLTRLRQINWWDIWQQETRTQVREFGYLPIGDQRVINQILRRQPELYYRLPCEWNVQVHMVDGVRCCPVHWIDRLPTEKDCKNRTSSAADDTMRSASQANLVHFNIEIKPESFGYYVPSENERVASMNPLTLPQLRHRFAQVYYKFRNMPEKCLQ